MTGRHRRGGRGQHRPMPSARRRSVHSRPLPPRRRGAGAVALVACASTVLLALWSVSLAPEPVGAPPLAEAAPESAWRTPRIPELRNLTLVPLVASVVAHATPTEPPDADSQTPTSRHSATVSAGTTPPKTAPPTTQRTAVVRPVADAPLTTATPTSVAPVASATPDQQPEVTSTHGRRTTPRPCSAGG